MTNILTFVLAVLLLVTIWETAMLLAMKKRLRQFFQTGSGDIESLLKDYLRRVEAGSRQITEVASALKVHDAELAHSFQKLGTVRYNPFEDTGGDQSFSVAFLDRADNGIVITSLHGRGSTRVYAKPVSSGKSQYNLSEEEQQAIGEAINGYTRKDKHV